MIGRPIRKLLLQSAEVQDLVGDNISPVRFSQGIKLPCIMYGTEGIRPLDSCRDADGVYQGVVEISLLAKRYMAIEDLMSAVRRCLDNYSGVIDGWALTISAGIEGPDDEDATLEAYYKRLDFSVTAEQLP
jgi:hypothetical protein